MGLSTIQQSENNTNLKLQSNEQVKETFIRKKQSRRKVFLWKKSVYNFSFATKIKKRNDFYCCWRVLNVEKNRVEQKKY